MLAARHTKPTVLSLRNCALALILIQIFQMFVLPCMLYGHSSLGLLVIPLILTGTMLWSLIHEAIHRLFLPTASINDGWGRVMGIFFGASFDVLKFGHVMHHRYNRDWESEYYDPTKKSFLRANIEYYSRGCPR